MIGIITSVLTGAASSFVVILILSRFARPEVSVSPVISKVSNGDSFSYVIKIINRSKRRLVNVQAELLLVKTKNIPGGTIVTTEKLSLIKDSVFVIDRYDVKDRDAKYAYRFRTNENIDEVWDDDDTQMIRFRVYGHNEISSFGRVFEQDYRIKRASVRLGEFNFGDNFDIT
ncbi:hypothetical protein [Thiolapillus sp.]